MHRIALLVVLAILPTSAVPAPAVPQAASTAHFETEYGTIVIEFLPTVAPKHVEAFTGMISEGFFDGTRFHRVVPGHFIQGGDPNSRDDVPDDDGLGRPDLPTIPAEFSTLKHERGTVSAARRGTEVDSATSQFFICVSDEPQYDGSYTIFGRVISGMEVVDRISAAPRRTDDKRYRERPVDPVAVTRAYLVPATRVSR